MITGKGEIEASTRNLLLISARISYDTGIDWRRKGEHEKAFECFSEAIGLDPEFVDAYFERGRVRERRNECEEAFADYDLAVQLASMNPCSWRCRGRMLAALGDYDAAISDLEKACELAPECWSVQAELRRVRRLQKDTGAKQAA